MGSDRDPARRIRPLGLPAGLLLGWILLPALTASGSPEDALAPALATHQNLLCTTCHDGHGETGNLHLVPEILDTPNSGPRAVVFVRKLGTNSYADGDAVLDGICEVCHTQTLYHRNEAGGDPTHFAQSRCTICHTHDLGFSPGLAAGVPDPGLAPPRILLSPSPTRGPLTVEVGGLRDPGRLRATLLDVRGRILAEIPPAAGSGDPVVLRWDGRVSGGSRVAPGVYFLRVETGHAAFSRRFVVLR